jgi:PAS domain S-box-containing protein
MTRNNKKILLVDDEEVIRLSFKRELQRYYDVTIAACYDEALALLSGTRFDLLITDLVMPGLDGLELLKKVKKNCPEMSTIVITAYGEISAVIEAMRTGADDFLLKPCDIEELLQRIVKTFEKQEYFTKISLYEKIFSTTDDLLALVDENGIYLEANSAYQRAYGKSRKQLIGCSMSDIVGRELFATKISSWLARCFSGACVQHLDLFKLSGQGVRSMVVSYCPVIRDGETAVTSATISMTDVTDIFHDTIGLQQREERLRMMHAVSSDGFMDCDLETDEIYYCHNWNKLLGYAPDTLQNTGKSWLDLLHSDDKNSTRKAFNSCLEGLADSYELEVRLQNANEKWMWFRTRGMVMERDGNGVPRRLIGTLIDITRQKKIEQEFLRDKELLEQNVAKQTEALARHNEELTESNAALTVLLKKRQQDKAEVEQRLSENVLKLIEPLVKRLQRTALNGDQVQLLSEIEESLHDITSSFITKLTSEYAGLTPMEIQVATHVKQGKATKEIADILCLAPDTVNVHRKKIRKKLGLRNKSINLQTFLTSLSEK